MARQSRPDNSAWPAVAVCAVLVLGAVALLTLYSHGSIQMISAPNATGNHTITISAQGFASGQPNQTLLYLRINGTGSTTQNAVANLSASTALLNKTLSSYIGGNLSNIMTTSYYVDVRCNNIYYPYSGSGGAAIYPYGYKCNSTATYEAVESLQVTLPNQANAGAALNSVSAIPNVYVESVQDQFSNAQVASLRPLALASAMANATAQARATLGNGYTVSAENISVNSFNYRVFPLYASGTAVGGSSPGAAPQPIIFPGTSQVTESITVIFSYSKQ